jgi:AcrR family transcriptional regulator
MRAVCEARRGRGAVSAEDASSLRDKILAEAIGIVAQAGAGSITMRTLAQRLGYSPATIYLHFRNKDELLKEIALHGFERLVEATRTAGQVADPRLAVIEGGRRYLEFALENPALYRLMFEEIDLSKYQSPADPFLPGRSLFDLYRELYERASRAGALRASPGIDADLATVIGWSAVHGFAMLALSGRLPPPRMAGRSVEEIREVFLGFLANLLRP